MKPQRAFFQHLLTPGGVRNVDGELRRIFALCRAAESQGKHKKGHETPAQIALSTAAAELLIARFVRGSRR